MSRGFGFTSNRYLQKRLFTKRLYFFRKNIVKEVSGFFSTSFQFGSAVKCDQESRIAPLIDSLGNFSAYNTWLGSYLFEVQAEPFETEIMSFSASITASESRPEKDRFTT